jgi:hypothetical protein
MIMAAAVIAILGTIAGITAQKVITDQQQAALKESQHDQQVDLTAAQAAEKVLQDQQLQQVKQNATRAAVFNQVKNTRNRWELRANRQKLNEMKVNNSIVPRKRYHRGSPELNA